MDSSWWEKIRSAVRVYVTAGFATALIVGAFMGKVDWKVIEAFATTVVGFWFGERSARTEATR